MGTARALLEFGVPNARTSEPNIAIYASKLLLLRVGAKVPLARKAGWMKPCSLLLSSASASIDVKPAQSESLSRRVGPHYPGRCGPSPWRGAILRASNLDRSS